MKMITDYEIVRHGIDNSQYFQGCGTAFTDFDEVATGIGDNPKEAAEDCLELLAQMGWDVDSNKDLIEEVNNLPIVPTITAEVNEEGEDEYPEDCYYYLSIRVK